MMFAVIASYLSKKGVFKHFGKTMLSAFLFACVGGGVGTILAWILFGFDIGTGVGAIIALGLHEIIGVHKFVALFIAEIVIDVADKLLTLAAIFTILKAIPARFLSKLPLGEVYIDKEKVDSDKILEDY